MSLTQKLNYSANASVVTDYKNNFFGNKPIEISNLVRKSY